MMCACLCGDLLWSGDQDGADGSILADNLFELNNGCICCTVKDDLVTTLETLLERRNKFDYVIIETTGLANPVRARPLILYSEFAFFFFSLSLFSLSLLSLSFSLSLYGSRRLDVC